VVQAVHTFEELRYEPDKQAECTDELEQLTAHELAAEQSEQLVPLRK
jgi:hypothetical protein